MKILLTNDDGINAGGLWALYQRFVRQDHFVDVIAPDRERSAVGHAISLNKPLRVRKVAMRNGDDGFAVTGTPADCIRLGFLSILKNIPDLVISGINPGANVGINLNYSGTVAAAREAALFGAKAMAVSINSPQPAHLEDAVGIIKRLSDTVLLKGLPEQTFLNVNIPNLPSARIAGARFLKHGIRLNGEHFEKRVDPRNRSYYWYGSDMQTRKNSLEDSHSVYHGKCVDAEYLNRNYIVITPVSCDTTDYHALEEMQRWDLNHL